MLIVNGGIRYFENGRSYYHISALGPSSATLPLVPEDSADELGCNCRCSESGPKAMVLVMTDDKFSGAIIRGSVAPCTFGGRITLGLVCGLYRGNQHQYQLLVSLAKDLLSLVRIDVRS